MPQLNLGNSQKLLERALKVIPTGTQTFSKSTYLYSKDNSPLFIDRAKGSHVWDIDGNEYVDFVSGLCPIILGYHDEDVDNAVIEQMMKGTIFSLPSPLEIEVSEMICDMVPCAEMVRFGKNGSDATSGAVRLARAFTGRDHVITCKGHYHGWCDWSNGITGRNLGVPSAVRQLSHQFKYNDIESLERLFDEFPNQVACVIMEPMTDEWPAYGFLDLVKEVCHKNNALFILDEIITGFRFAVGGAQEEFKIVPDLACMGKAMANGYPLSAIAGQKEFMKWFEKIHFSFTFGGECLSLAAAKVTLRKIKELNVPQHIWKLGKMIKDHLQGNQKGHPSRILWNFKNDEFKQALIKESIEHGFLMIGFHNLNYSHTAEEIEKLLSFYDEFLSTHSQDSTSRTEMPRFEIR